MDFDRAASPDSQSHHRHRTIFVSTIVELAFSIISLNDQINKKIKEWKENKWKELLLSLCYCGDFSFVFHFANTWLASMRKNRVGHLGSAPKFQKSRSKMFSHFFVCIFHVFHFICLFVTRKNFENCRKFDLNLTKLTVEQNYSVFF